MANTDSMSLPSSKSSKTRRETAVSDINEDKVTNDCMVPPIQLLSLFHKNQFVNMIGSHGFLLFIYHFISTFSCCFSLKFK